MTEPEATSETPAPSQSGVVDLSDLRLMPSWVAGIGSSPQQRHHDVDEDQRRGPRREGDRRGGPPRRDGGQGGRDRGGFQGRDRRDGPHGGRGDRDQRGQGRFGDRGGDRPQREWQEIPRDISVVIEPEDKAVDALAGHIRSSGHAFSMFDAARLVLAEGDRYQARFSCAPERASGLYVTLVDGGVFLGQEEAMQHLLRSSAMEKFYRTEEIEQEEPKGDFKSVAVCGMTGELLGPPSHHSFQSSVIRLHRERFSHMPLEDYKRRVRVESNPDLVAQWKEKQRKAVRWVAAGETAEGEEAETFSSRAEMEAHFRRTHAPAAVREARDVVIHGSLDKAKMTHVLFIMMRQAAENARKHLFEMSQKLGGGFERRGLKLFKRRAGKLFVSRVKPRAIDPGVVLSERVARIVEILRSRAGMSLHDLVEAIVPSAPVAEGEEKPATPAHPTEEQISVIKDIRWLANEGYVIEYSDGMVFLGVQGEPHAAKAAAPTRPAAEAGAPGDPQKTEETTATPPTAPAAGEAQTAASAEAAPTAEEPAVQEATTANETVSEHGQHGDEAVSSEEAGTKEATQQEGTAEQREGMEAAVAHAGSESATQAHLDAELAATDPEKAVAEEIGLEAGTPEPASDDAVVEDEAVAVAQDPEMVASETAEEVAAPKKDDKQA